MNLNIISKIFPPDESIAIEKLGVDTEGIYSITLPIEAEQISYIISRHIGSNGTIFDGTAGLGGNTLSFCKNFSKVVAVEIDNLRYKLLTNNIAIYKYNNIQTYNNCCVHCIENTDNIDAYYFDPPWGGPDYKHSNKISVKLGNLTLSNIIIKIKKTSSGLIFFKLPNNYSLAEFDNYNYSINKIKNYQLITIY